MHHVVCAGLVAVDFTFELSRFPGEGTKSRAEGAHMVPGGGALIAASAVAALGGQASLAGAVGADSLGDYLRGELAMRGIDATHLHSLPGVATSRSAVLVTPGGERTVINHRDLALFPETPPLHTDFDAALADTRWPAGAAALMRAAKAAGKPGVLDGEAPVRLAREALHLASHIVFSEQGLADLAGACDAPALAAVARDTGAFIAVTRGARPVLCHDGQGTFEVPAFAVKPVDTLGAGDVWHAAFALALAGGLPVRDAVRRANAAAAVKAMRPAGAMPDRAAVTAMLRGGVD